MESSLKSPPLYQKAFLIAKNIFKNVYKLVTWYRLYQVQNDAHIWVWMVDRRGFMKLGVDLGGTK
ncbi:hypothetical protein, partial [Oleiphilus sp. HI0086]|uniref:hypothetical protein n=1 Tax=Oleiphilus sp. HI0086 TaxID=1822260 RepID=UPI000AA5EE6E